MPSLGGEAPSRHRVAEEPEKNEILSRAGGTLASALPSDGVYAIAHHAHPFRVKTRSGNLNLAA